MGISEFFDLKTVLTSLGTLAGTLFVTKVTEKIYEAHTAVGKVKREHQKELLDKLYFPVYKNIYHHAFYGNLSYKDIADFIAFLESLIEYNLLLTPPTIIGKVLALKEKMRSANQKGKIDFIVKMRFTELKDLLLRRYYSSRHKFHHFDISFREIWNASSPLKLLIIFLYFCAALTAGLNGYLVYNTGYFSIKSLIIELISSAVFLACIILLGILSS